jgi:hypothetical protein
MKHIMTIGLLMSIKWINYYWLSRRYNIESIFSNNNLALFKGCDYFSVNYICCKSWLAWITIQTKWCRTWLNTKLVLSKLRFFFSRIHLSKMYQSHRRKSNKAKFVPPTRRWRPHPPEAYSSACHGRSTGSRKEIKVPRNSLARATHRTPPSCSP